ncbi:hypothetical protein [Nocardioides anomalus]|nr:hypothetical protein [Nocardioides anomalus]
MAERPVRCGECGAPLQEVRGEALCTSLLCPTNLAGQEETPLAAG